MVPYVDALTPQSDEAEVLAALDSWVATFDNSTRAGQTRLLHDLMAACVGERTGRPIQITVAEGRTRTRPA